jgi:hypothetical protein
MPADFLISIIDAIKLVICFSIIVNTKSLCQKCGFGVVSKKVSPYLREYYRDIAIPDRKRLAIAIAKLPGIIQDQAGLSEFLFPSPTISYITLAATVIITLIVAAIVRAIATFAATFVITALTI